MAFSTTKPTSFLPILFLLYSPLACLSQTQTNSTSSPTTPSNATYPKVRGCGDGLHPDYSYLCDRRAAWGIILETLASAGFLLSIGLLLGLLFWALCRFLSSPNRSGSTVGGTVLSMSMFLFATAGIFAITFSFIIKHNPQTCPTRIFLFGVLFSLAFSCLLARCLAMLGFAAARSWGEPAVALGLFVVQVIISTQWLIIVLVRDKNPCEYSQAEFAMLQIYVLCLLLISLILSLKILCRSCFTYTYSYTGPTNQQWKPQAAALCITLVLSACIWVVWIAMLTRGNEEVNKQPVWDDPVLSIALVTNGWVLLLGHGISQVALFCRGEATAQEVPLSFAGWTHPNADIPGLGSQKEGKENGSYESDSENRRGRRAEPALRSPYESGFSMTEIDPNKDYTIPRPQTTNFNQPYDEYYAQQ
ncbi:PREDICTED: G-protein coupled receptor family C group 5 member D-like [Cyprinodon variegatus]|uniref:G protein-coupled receptor class C group 5 member D n=1 Tax=Cyprinodon variegatus TaxID=28743 RepID=A0A3Q2D5P2_CYPVA|nr:PREDICTED: G-protein coupled receptor family C group 5 member D-like [Cyprinodon variegatus]